MTLDELITELCEHRRKWGGRSLVKIHVPPAAGEIPDAADWRDIDEIATQSTHNPRTITIRPDSTPQ